jgi:hypothetical protein
MHRPFLDGLCFFPAMLENYLRDRDLANDFEFALQW